MSEFDTQERIACPGLSGFISGIHLLPRKTINYKQMKNKIFLSVVILLMVVQYATVQAANFVVSTVSGFNNAQSSAQAGDTITWNSGTFSGIDLNIVKKLRALIDPKLHQ